jgi:hypothetical protein
MTVRVIWCAVKGKKTREQEKPFQKPRKNEGAGPVLSDQEEM